MSAEDRPLSVRQRLLIAALLVVAFSLMVLAQASAGSQNAKVVPVGQEPLNLRGWPFIAEIDLQLDNGHRLARLLTAAMLVNALIGGAILTASHNALQSLLIGGGRFSLGGLLGAMPALSLVMVCLQCDGRLALDMDDVCARYVTFDTRWVAHHEIWRGDSPWIRTSDSGFSPVEASPAVTSLMLPSISPWLLTAGLAALYLVGGWLLVSRSWRLVRRLVPHSTTHDSGPDPRRGRAPAAAPPQPARSMHIGMLLLCGATWAGLVAWLASIDAGRWLAPWSLLGSWWQGTADLLHRPAWAWLLLAPALLAAAYLVGGVQRLGFRALRHVAAWAASVVGHWTLPTLGPTARDIEETEPSIAIVAAKRPEVGPRPALAAGPVGGSAPQLATCGPQA